MPCDIVNLLFQTARCLGVPFYNTLSLQLTSLIAFKLASSIYTAAAVVQFDALLLSYSSIVHAAFICFGADYFNALLIDLPKFRLALKIQGAISRVCSRELRNIDKKRGTAALCRGVNNLTKGPRQPETGSEITAEELNDHYARVSTDPHYAPPALRSTAYNKREDFTEAEIFYALDRLRPTSEGADRLPSWFLKIAAPI